MPIEINAKEYPLKDIFSDSYTFKIPYYQRPYLWSEKEITELIDDILDSLGSFSQNIDEKNPYFLGSVVLEKKKDNPLSEILDGQQRLITLTILFSTLRAINASISESISAFILEKGNKLKGTIDQYRVQLKEEDKIFFEKYIQKENNFFDLLKLDVGTLQSISQKNIRKNAEFFYNRLHSYSKEETEQFAEFLCKKCLMVIVTTYDFDSAYKIFSILNDRGIDLEPTDILKADIIGGLTKNEIPEFSRRWESIEKNLGRESFQDLFSNIRMIYRKVKMRSIIGEYRDYILKTKPLKDFLINDVFPYGDAFEQIISMTYECTSDNKTSTINKYFKFLSKIDNIDWQAPALQYLKMKKDHPDKLIDFYSRLERLAAGMMILRCTVNERIERYGKVLQEIEKKADFQTNGASLDLSKEECEKIIKELDGDIYNKYGKLRLMIMLRIDEILSEGEASYNYNVTTIEHVLPQTPSGEWLKWWPEEKVREEWINRIGNLVLLNRRQNSSAQNYDFSIKKERYFVKSGVSPYAITSQVLNEKKWTPEVVEKRQKQLIDKFIEVWNLK
jgi:uncharacterized protein with ParB-like and HNH nuclease domain